MQILDSFTGVSATYDAEIALGRECGPGAQFVASRCLRRASDGRIFAVEFGAYPMLVELTEAEGMARRAGYWAGLAEEFEAKAADPTYPKLLLNWARDMARRYRQSEREAREAARELEAA